MKDEALSYAPTAPTPATSSSLTTTPPLPIWTDSSSLNTQQESFTPNTRLIF